MRAIETLMEEHRLIERVLDALTGCAEAVQRGDDVSREELGSFVGFIRGYADAHHHGKEEDILFRTMNESGMPSTGGPLAVMLHEHTEGRNFTSLLAEVAEGEGALAAEERTQWVRAGTGYVNLLRAHIQKEDQVLYPMATQLIPSPAWEALEGEFATFEADAENVARATELRAAAETLIARYA